jgi:hypothetical protein
MGTLPVLWESTHIFPFAGRMDGGCWSVHGPFLVEQVEVNLKLSLLSPVPVLIAYKNFFSCFLSSSYVGFVPVSNLLGIYSSIWECVFSSKFLFVTDPKPKFGWRVYRGPRSPKTFYVLGDPKRFTKILQCCWGCLDLAMPLGIV